MTDDFILARMLLLIWLWLVVAVFCIGSALQTCARSLTQITAGRAIGGLGVGALRYSLTYPLDVPSKTFDRPFWHFDDIV